MRRFRGGRGIGALAVALVLAAGAGAAYATHELGKREGAVHICYDLKTGAARVVQVSGDGGVPAECPKKEALIEVATYDEAIDARRVGSSFTYISAHPDPVVLADDADPEPGLVHELQLPYGDEEREAVGSDKQWVLLANLTLTNPPNQPRANVHCSLGITSNAGGEQEAVITLPATDSSDHSVPIHLTTVGFSLAEDQTGQLFCQSSQEEAGAYARLISLVAMHTNGINPDFGPVGEE